MTLESTRIAIKALRFLPFLLAILRNLAAFFAIWTADHAGGHTYEGRGYGRLQEYGSASRWPSETGEDSIPRGEETKRTCVRRAAPSLGGREASECLMRSDVVVPGANRVEVRLNLARNAGFGPPFQDSFLEGSEEPLDSSVLPRTERVGRW